MILLVMLLQCLIVGLGLDLALKGGFSLKVLLVTVNLNAVDAQHVSSSSFFSYATHRHLFELLGGVERTRTGTRIARAGGDQLRPGFRGHALHLFDEAAQPVAAGDAFLLVPVIVVVVEFAQEEQALALSLALALGPGLPMVLILLFFLLHRLLTDPLALVICIVINGVGHGDIPISVQTIGLVFIAQEYVVHAALGCFGRHHCGQVVVVCC